MPDNLPGFFHVPQEPNPFTFKSKEEYMEALDKYFEILNAASEWEDKVRAQSKKERSEAQEELQ